MEKIYVKITNLGGGRKRPSVVKPRKLGQPI